MRKLHEITGDEFFDIIYALSPVLPMIGDMEIIQTQFSSYSNDRINEARVIIASERDKKVSDLNIINSALKTIEAEQIAIFTRDVSKIVPLLASKQNRGIIFEVLSILEQLPVDEVRKYSTPKLIARIRQVVSDADFKSFFTYAEPSEQSE